MGIFTSAYLSLSLSLFLSVGGNPEGTLRFQCFGGNPLALNACRPFKTLSFHYAKTPAYPVPAGEMKEPPSNLPLACGVKLQAAANERAVMGTPAMDKRNRVPHVISATLTRPAHVSKWARGSTNLRYGAPKSRPVHRSLCPQSGYHVDFANLNCHVLSGNCF